MGIAVGLLGRRALVVPVRCSLGEAPRMAWGFEGRGGGRAADRIGDGDRAVSDLQHAFIIPGAVLTDETNAMVLKLGKLVVGEGARLAAVVLPSVLEPNLYNPRSAQVLWTRQRHESGSIDRPLWCRGTYLDLLLGEGNTLHKSKTRLLVRLAIVLVRLLEYHLVLSTIRPTY